MPDKIQAYPKMLYSLGEGNKLLTLIVQSEDEHKEAGKEWKEEPPKPKGRPAGSKNKTAESEDEA